MASNDVTKRLRALSFFFFLVSGGVNAAPGAACVEKWAGSSFGQKILEQKKNDATLKSFLSSATSDFLVAAALDLEQKVLSHCSDPGLSGLLQQLQVAYLTRLEVKAKPREAGLYFKGLVTSQAEGAELHKALKKIPAKEKLKPLELFARIYGAAALVRGVLVVGAAPLPVDLIYGLARQACEKNDPCAFWDPAFIARVVIVPGNAQAAYLPELASLRVSADLVKTYSPLRQVVLLHELAHVAEWRARQQLEEDWKQQFQVFSGWKLTPSGWQTPVVASEDRWGDELAKESAHSAFSLLPDPVFLAQSKNGEELDGFVFARSERETKKSGDVGEDLADHIAAFLAAPQRFCYQMKPVAPQKYQWIAKNVFHRNQRLNCTSILK